MEMEIAGILKEHCWYGIQRKLKGEKMRDKVELTGLKIKTKDGVFELSIEEAKQLYLQLHELFGEKVIHMPSAPIIIERFPQWPIYPPLITGPKHVEPDITY